MFDQTTLEGRGPHPDGVNDRPDRAARAMQGNMADFAHDVATLAELQGELAAADLKEMQSKAILPGVLLALGLGVLLACFPILLFGIAYVLVEEAGMRQWTSFLLTTVIGLVLAGGLLGVAWWRLRTAVSSLNRSYTELQQNTRWMLDVMKRSRRVRRECT